MRYVKQKHKNGCCIASIAMLTGIGYKKIHNLVYQKMVPNLFINGEYWGLELEDILRIFDNLKIKYRLSFKKDFLKLNNNAFVCYKADIGRHAVIWDVKNQKILNPLCKCTKIQKCLDNLEFYIEVLS